jgi:hypothetical protein
LLVMTAEAVTVWPEVPGPGMLVSEDRPLKRKFRSPRSAFR